MPRRGLLPPEWRARVDAFDERVDAAFDRLRGKPVVDRTMYAVTELADFGLLWLIAGALRGLRSEHDWHAAVRVGVVLAAESVVVNAGVKSVFRRRRPVWEGPRPFKLRIPVTSSFPSGHASSAFCAAGLLAEDDVLWPVYYALAATVAASRVHVRIHHASDVLGGVALGMLLARAGRRMIPLPVAPAESLTGS